MQAPKPEMFQRSDSDAGVGDDDQSTVNKWPFNIRSTRSRVSRGASRGTVKPQARSGLVRTHNPHMSHLVHHIPRVLSTESIDLGVESHRSQYCRYVPFADNRRL